MGRSRSQEAFNALVEEIRIRTRSSGPNTTFLGPCDMSVIPEPPVQLPWSINLAVVTYSDHP